MIEWFGDRMLPKGMRAFCSEITPLGRIPGGLEVVVHNRKRRPGLLGSVSTEEGSARIDLYPTAILARVSGPGTYQFNVWLKFLRTYLHEVGHIETARLAARGATWRGYRENECHARYVERLADFWADQTLSEIADRDSRLGQPEGFIGGLPGVYILMRGAENRENGYGSRAWLTDYRGFRCGGQLSLSDVVRRTLMLSGVDVTDGPMPRTKRRIRARVIGQADRLGIHRAWVDSAGRVHRFFTHGEAQRAAEATCAEPGFARTLGRKTTQAQLVVGSC